MTKIEVEVFFMSGNHAKYLADAEPIISNTPDGLPASMIFKCNGRRCFVLMESVEWFSTRKVPDVPNDGFNVGSIGNFPFDNIP